MKEKLKDKSLLIYIVVNFLYILICSFLALNQYITSKIFSYGYIILLGANILIILILFFKKKYKKNIIDIFLVLIIVFAIISTILAYNRETALFGSWDRYEGLFTISYYITLLFITSFLKKEDRKKVVYGILIFGFIQCMYAICQKLNLFNAHTKIVHGWRWATGFTSNRNFFGILMLMCTGYSIGLFLKSKDRLEIVFYLFLIYLFSTGMLLSKSIGCLLGLITIIIIVIIYAIKNKYIKKLISICIIIIFNFIFLDCMRLTAYIHDLSGVKTDVVEISKGNITDEQGTGRVKLWKEIIKIVPKYIIHGVGVDNFRNVLDGKPIVNKELKLVYDKAHNEYLQILVTMGIFSLLSYLCLHFIIIKNGIKNAFKDKEMYLILPVIGYIVQAQFNISVIEVAPIFYIGLGLLVERNK